MIMYTTIITVDRSIDNVQTRKIDTFLKVQKEKKSIEY
jgi:hypothetical protein